MKKQTIWILLIILVVFVLSLLYYYAVSSVYRISSEEAKRRIRDKEIDVVLDVRTNLERATLGYYPGSDSSERRVVTDSSPFAERERVRSIHIPSAELDTKVAQQLPNKSAKILVYCNTGQRARAATEKLRGLGYTNVHYIATSHRSLMV